MRVSDRYLPSRVAFTAIDFETADVDPETACAVGVVRVREGRVRSVRRWFLRPPEGSTFRFTALHGIDEAQTREAKPLGVVARYVASDLARAAFIAAHHARFDARVLAALVQRSSILVPRRPFVCTARLFELTFGRCKRGLDACCRHLGIPLRHHDPRADAIAAARIVLAATPSAKGRRALGGLVETARWWS